MKNIQIKYDGGVATASLRKNSFFQLMQSTNFVETDERRKPYSDFGKRQFIATVAMDYKREKDGTEIVGIWKEWGEQSIAIQVNDRQWKVESTLEVEIEEYSFETSAWDILFVVPNSNKCDKVGAKESIECSSDWFKVQTHREPGKLVTDITFFVDVKELKDHRNMLRFVKK
jgi:hypothetical protein